MSLIQNSLIALAIAAWHSAPVLAAATVHEYTIAGTVDGGGVITGFFTLTENNFVDGSPGHLSFSNVDVNVTGGSGYHGETFTDSPIYSGRQISEENSTKIGASIQFNDPFQAFLSLNFLYPDGGAIITTTPSQFNQSLYVGGGNGFFVHGSVTPMTIGAVPETGTWLMTIIGFGFAGSMLRRGRALDSGRARTSFA